MMDKCLFKTGTMQLPMSNAFLDSHGISKHHSIVVLFRTSFSLMASRSLTRLIWRLYSTTTTLKQSCSYTTHTSIRSTGFQISWNLGTLKKCVALINICHKYFNVAKSGVFNFIYWCTICFRQQPWVKFATFNDVFDIKHRTYKIILKKGGCIVPDDTALLSLNAGK